MKGSLLLRTADWSVSPEPAPASAGQHSPAALAYRRDIDGLRAVAVLAVVFFHARIPGFPGGFIGVDIFFVLSGYLITGILRRELDRGRFSLLSFYERRVRRIIPALLAVLTVTTVASYLLLLPEDFRRFGRSLVAAIAFSSNAVFYLEAGYFDLASHSKPLLHTWSLGVEEQFYLIFPLLLYALYRWTRKALGLTLGLLAAGSFVLSIVWLWRDPSAAFFLAPMRAWELLLGSLAAIGAVSLPASGRVRFAASAAGMALIAIGVTQLAEGQAFPGFNALLPCVGTLLILLAGEGETPLPSRLILCSPLMVWVGLISYSLYLWHWPLFAFATYRMSEPPGVAVGFLLVLASLALAAVSTLLIENPVRLRVLLASRRALFLSMGAWAALLVGFGSYIYLNAGLPARVPAEVARAGTPVQFLPAGCAPGKDGRYSCTTGTGSPVVLWGDSHAGAILPAIEGQAGDRGRSVALLMKYRCPPLADVRLAGDLPAGGCASANAASLGELLSDRAPATIFIHARWSVYTAGAFDRAGNPRPNPPLLLGPDGRALNRKEREQLLVSLLDRTVGTLVRAGKRVILIGPTPEPNFDVPSTVAIDLWNGGVPRTMSRAAVEGRHAASFAALDGVAGKYGLPVVLPHRAVCPGEICLLSRAGLPLYLDDDHVNRRAAPLLGPLFAPAFDAAEEDRSAGEVSAPRK